MAASYVRRPTMPTYLADSITRPINLEFTPGAGMIQGPVNISTDDGTIFHNFRVKNITWNDISTTGTAMDTSQYAPFFLEQVENKISCDLYYPSATTTNVTASNDTMTLNLEATYANGIYWEPTLASGNYGFVWPVSPKEQLKQIIRERQAPRIITSKSIARTNDIREMRARETLRRVLGAKNFGTFMKRGFVAVKAKSGLMYQIFPGHGITNVYNNGKKVERLCVVLRHDFAPTDSIIMRYLLILNNEDRFRSLAVKHHVGNTYQNGNGYITFIDSAMTQRYADKSLVQIYKEIKGMAA